jgi:hypothetical protein
MADKEINYKTKIEEDLDADIEEILDNMMDSEEEFKDEKAKTSDMYTINQRNNKKV